MPYKLRMRYAGCWSGVILAAALACPARAEPQAEQPTVEALIKKIDALQRRLDEVEGRQQAAKSSTNKPSASATHRTPSPPVATAIPASTPVQPYPAVPLQQAPAPVPGLLPPERMGNQYEGEGGDALRSDLPGLSLRIPGSQSEVRFYGFANLNGYRDLNGRNQTDAPTVQTVPLARSPADMQGGDFGLSARFSRLGMDTRTAIAWGTLETRVEGDFGGGAPAASTNARLSAPSGLGRIRHGAIPRAGRMGEQPVERRRLRNCKLCDQPQSVLRAPAGDSRNRNAGPGINRPSLARNAGHTVYVRGWRIHADQHPGRFYRSQPVLYLGARSAWSAGISQRRPGPRHARPVARP